MHGHLNVKFVSDSLVTYSLQVLKNIMGMPYLKTVHPWCGQNAELFNVKICGTHGDIKS